MLVTAYLGRESIDLEVLLVGAEHTAAIAFLHL